MRSVFARIALFLLLGIAALTASRGTAEAAFTSSFDELRAELQRRHDNDYSGTLTRTQRKELAAIDAAIARIDAPADDVLDDVKSFRVVSKRLATAFRGEFTGAEPGPLAGLVADTATALIAQAESSLGSLEMQAAALTDQAVRDRALAFATTARGLLEDAAAPGTSPSAAAALLKRALQAIGKGVAVVEAGKADRLVVTMNGRAYTGTQVAAQVGLLSGDPYIVLTAQLENPATRRRESFALVMRADAGVPTEIGAFTPFGSNYLSFGVGETQDGYFFSQFSPKSTFTITGFDAETRVVTGTFSCYLQRNGSMRLTMTKGSFRVTGTPLPFGD